MEVLNMDKKAMVNSNKDKQQSRQVHNLDKQETVDSLIQKNDSKKYVNTNGIYDEKDLLIAQLQEQVTKQRECISYYENIVQLMNCRLMKLKKVLKAHQLLQELD